MIEQDFQVVLSLLLVNRVFTFNEHKLCGEKFKTSSGTCEFHLNGSGCTI